MNKAIVLLLASLFFGGCAVMMPEHRVEKFEPPSDEYYFYSGNRETLGDVWTRETVLEDRKTGKNITLLGMFHIADREFYRQVQQRIDSSDLVLAEGVGGKSNLTVSSFFYTYVFALYHRGANWQRLASQGYEINIPPEKYFNADISMTELESHNDWKSGLGQLASLPLMMLVIEPSLLISDLNDLLHFAESDVSARKRYAARRHLLFSGSPERDRDLDRGLTPGILGPRNEKLLEVISEQMKKDEVQSVLIPWGAAHLQDIEKALVKDGYVVTESRWLRTIAVKELMETDTELTKSRKINLPYLYTYYRYPHASEHNFLFQLFHGYSGDDYGGFDLGYGHLMRYQSGEAGSYFSLLPSLFGRPLLFDYTRVNGEGKIGALLFINF